MADPTPLNRNQIARFVGNDPDAIRALERLFVVAGDIIPSDIATITSDIATNTGNIATNTFDIATNTGNIATVNTRIDNLVIDDLADVNATSPTLGMVLIYDATADEWQANTITAGSNITITNADGAITVAVSGLGTMAFENTGATGSFTAASLETVTVVNGIITSIV